MLREVIYAVLALVALISAFRTTGKAKWGMLLVAIGFIGLFCDQYLNGGVNPRSWVLASGGLLIVGIIVYWIGDRTG